jgi:hypothetical protein
VSDQLSATVLLRPAAGGTHEGVTAETVERFQPDPDALERARRFFEAAGFELGPAVGPSFSITGPRELFERTFDTKLEYDETLGIKASGGGVELPLHVVPPELTDSLQAVTFTPPPAFGPTEY